MIDYMVVKNHDFIEKNKKSDSFNLIRILKI